jgi:predicted ATPase
MITRFEVQGYRLLDDFGADLGQLTVVIGANATGKSTMIDCLRLVTECAEFPLQKALEWHGGLFSLPNASSQTREIRWSVALERPKSNPFWRSIPLPENWSFVYHVSIAWDRAGQAFPLTEILQNAQPARGHATPLKYLEASPDRSMIFDGRQHKLVPFDEAVPQQAPGQMSQGARQGEVPTPPKALSQEPALRLSKMRFFNEYPVPSWVRSLLSSFCFYPGFDVGRFSPLRTKAAEIRPETTLFPSGENLGTVLHEMMTRHDYRLAAQNLKDFLRAAYPSFENISVETTYGTPPMVLVRLREGGMTRPMELWDLSDGMLRFLCLGAALLNPLPPPFLAMDEPEAGLHPKLLPIVADMIKTASEKTQVLVTTHSPDLLNRFDLDDIAVMSRDGPHAIWRRPGNRSSLRQMLAGVTGETIGDLHRTGELEAIE